MEPGAPRCAGRNANSKKTHTIIRNFSWNASRAASAISFLGFLIVFGFHFGVVLIIFISSLTSAILMSHLVVSMA